MATLLRKRMQDDLQLAGLRQGTQKVYLGAIRQLARTSIKLPIGSARSRSENTCSTSRTENGSLPTP